MDAYLIGFMNGWGAWLRRRPPGKKVVRGTEWDVHASQQETTGRRGGFSGSLGALVARPSPLYITSVFFEARGGGRARPVASVIHDRAVHSVWSGEYAPSEDPTLELVIRELETRGARRYFIQEDAGPDSHRTPEYVWKEVTQDVKNREFSSW